MIEWMNCANLFLLNRVFDKESALSWNVVSTMSEIYMIYSRRDLINVEIRIEVGDLF